VTRAVIALGSNLGDRLKNLRDAVSLLRRAGVAADACSSIWETDPVPPDQPRFLNAVVAGETPLAPEQLLDTLKRIESEMGRTEGRRWGPRTIDLDILFYGEISYESERLTIPHPRIAERAFVLAPLAEVISDPLPVLNMRASYLLERVGTEPVRRTAEALASGPTSAEVGE
jgi:2-amino-4-hydroxy-6-hydroxymethyldihydropteridine diphosphokinase